MCSAGDSGILDLVCWRSVASVALGSCSCSYS